MRLFFFLFFLSFFLLFFGCLGQAGQKNTEKNVNVTPANAGKNYAQNETPANAKENYAQKNESMAGNATSGQGAGNATSGQGGGKEAEAAAAPYPFANVSTHKPKGAANASVVMEEYVSFSCGVSARGRNLTDRAMQQNPELALRLRHFPLPQTPGAELASQAFECAADQGMEWEIEGVLYSNETWFDYPGLNGAARKIGANESMFKWCLESGAKKKIVDDDIAGAKELGVRGTPFFVIGNATIPGLLDDDDFLAVVRRDVKEAATNKKAS